MVQNILSSKTVRQLDPCTAFQQIPDIYLGTLFIELEKVMNIFI